MTKKGARTVGDRLHDAITLVNNQAEDEGLWFLNPTASEAYLQQALRALHAVIEGDAGEPNGGLPVASPDDPTKFYSRPFASMLGFVFRPGWELQRLWKDGENVCFIGGPLRIGPEEPDNDLVICPQCTSQFRAIPVNVQKRLRELEP